MTDTRYFSSDPARRKIAISLYETVAGLPLICPHGHVDPRLFAEAGFTFGSPVDLLIIPDHYIFRMLYSQGIALERLGIPRSDGGSTENDHRKVWRIVCENWHLFTGTPTGLWLRDELREVFGIDQKINAQNADSLYDQIAARLDDADFQPRTLYEKFNIEALTTTDPATSRLEHHAAIRDFGWGGRILPTFRPDAVVNMEREDWRENIRLLAEVTGTDIGPYTNYIRALEQQRAAFKAMGATATDHAALTPYTEPLSLEEAEAIFQRGLFGVATEIDAARFGAHMLIEMARMSSEDGLVMQLHVGSHRDHNPAIYQKFGRDMGADIPITAEFTRNLKPLLDRFGNHPNLTLVLFNLDESTYSRELAPLAGHYPILKLGPPWWFYDSINGMIRFLDGVVETAGLYNTAGFNDDTRAFASIPARHDLWRRVSADWLADLVARHIIDEEDAREMIVEMAYGLAKRAYKL
jgi:glucuronate isomerase